MSVPIHFILNKQDVRTEAAPGMLVLDYLREYRRLVGTKEGCKEGDCGACVVLIGELSGKSVAYKPVTSCLMPVGELHGKHLVTIEGLNMESLTPVQQAIVDEGGSQCGFCTPGIVMSLTGYLLQEAPLDSDGIKIALGGNLCRCTGYASLKRAGQKLIDRFEHSQNGKNLKPNIDSLIEQRIIPEYFETIPKRLKNIPAPEPMNGKTQDYFIAGGTDLYVQKGDEIPDSNAQLLNLFPEMKGISKKDGYIHVGALTTFEEFAHHPEITKIIPEMLNYNLYNASWQIRNRATLGGNIVNASPIGDMTALLLALEADLILQNNGSKRTVPMKSFFKGYKILDKKPNDILSEIIFPVPSAGTKINFEKVSKRKMLDIAAVNSAIKITVTQNSIEDSQLTMGGVAPIPLFLKKTCDFLTGQTISCQTVAQAIDVALQEISPISDIRGSADYKRLLTRQLIIAHFSKLFPEFVTAREFYETH